MSMAGRIPPAADVNKRVPPHTASVGNETKAGMGKAGLGGAVAELHRQHPIKHDDLGPHHGKK